MLTETPRPIYLKDYRPPEYLIDQVDLVVDLGEEQTLVQSRLEIRRNPDGASSDGSLRLDGEQLDLRSIALNGEVLAQGAYRLDEESVTLFEVPERFFLEIVVSIQPQNNTALEGLYRSGNLFCTQCEAEGFRRITYFLDRPDVMSRFATTITAAKAKFPVMLSNGNPTNTEVLPDGRHRIKWVDPFPKPCYLFALVAGDLRHIEDRYVTASGREIVLRIYVEPENIDKCEHAMRSLENAMRWDEQNYGREYDLDIYMIVAVNDFNMGAMENKGLNIFNSKYVLARPDTATDQDYQGIEGVIAHEYFHNWTGNRITCRDWFQLSLKEGLTVFRDQEFSADMGSRGVKRIEDVRILRSHQFAEDAGPMSHPVRPDSYIEINNFYTVTVYNKGAELIRMQRNLLGPEGYRKGMDLYFQRHDGQAVTTDDFVQCMQDASGHDLTQFRLWYSQAGTPRLRIEGSYDEQQHSFTLRVDQQCAEKRAQAGNKPFHIPLALGLLDAQGHNLPLQLEGEKAPVAAGRVLELRRASETFRFTNVPVKPLPSLLRGFSAPVKVDYPYSDDDLMFLLAHDSDAFSRWDAAQTLAQRVLLDMVRQHQAGQPMQIPDGLIDAFATALSKGSTDKQLLAEILLLPSESYLGDQMATVDVDGIHSACEALRYRLADELTTLLLRTYEHNLEKGGYDISPVSIGRRALKNRCLQYLVVLREPRMLELCLEQFHTAGNMTDAMAALSALADVDCAQRTEALETFAHRWEQDPLVMDKWFALQAMSHLPDTLKRVRALMRHRAFSIRNPNKVRSLIGAFCAGNVTGFHAADGSGYRFLAERILEIDALNPQIAARLARAMIRWRRYDAQRQRLMQRQMEHILNSNGISRDVYEVVARSLESE